MSDSKDDLLRKLLSHLLEHPEERTPEVERLVRELMLDPHYEVGLIDRIKRDALAPEMLNLLLDYAAEREPSARRSHARRVLSAGWHVDESLH